MKDENTVALIVNGELCAQSERILNELGISLGDIIDISLLAIIHQSQRGNDGFLRKIMEIKEKIAYQGI